MNRTIPQIGAAIVTVTVFLFAVCLIFDFSFGSYFVCMFLPLGYIMMAVGFQYECDEIDGFLSISVLLLVLSMQYWFFWYTLHRQQVSDWRI